MPAQEVSPPGAKALELFLGITLVLNIILTKLSARSGLEIPLIPFNIGPRPLLRRKKTHRLDTHRLVLPIWEECILEARA